MTTIPTAAPPPATTASPPPAATASRPPASVGAKDLTPAATPAVAERPERTLERVVPEAASAMFPDRSVDVSSFFDEGSGRYVYRVADRLSGEVLAQHPAEELLRFYREARAAPDPLVAVTA